MKKIVLLLFTFNYYTIDAYYCASGIQNENVCCLKECGSCGGKNCSTRVGGADNCCMSNIYIKNKYCNTASDVSCIIPECCFDSRCKYFSEDHWCNTCDLCDFIFKNTTTKTLNPNFNSRVFDKAVKYPDIQVIKHQLENESIIKVNYIPIERGSRRVTFTLNVDPRQEYTLTYYVKFDSAFEFVKGGKLHGLGSKSYTTGCKQQTSQNWSVRVMWSKNGQLSSYIYHQKRKNKCGESKKSLFIMKKNVWYKISIFLKLNDKYKHNGTTSIFVNDKKIMHQTGIEFRKKTNKESLINNFLFNTFFGGSDISWSPSRLVSAYFKNFTLH